MVENPGFRPALCDQQIESYHANGYVIAGRIIDDADLEDLRTVYDDVVREASSRDMTRALRGIRPNGAIDFAYIIRQPEGIYSEFHETSFFRSGRSLASQVLETPESELNSTSDMIFKPPFDGTETPWHQDEATWQNPRAKYCTPWSVSVWLTLDHASVESGCMRFIPKSHDRVLPHGFVDEESSCVVIRDVDTARAVSCPVGPGEATMHSPRVVHGAGTNTTRHPRRAWIITFHGDPKPRTEPDNRYWLPEMERRVKQQWGKGLI